MESAPMSRSLSARASMSSSASASQATSVFGAGALSPSGDAGLMGMNGLVAVLRILKLVDTASGLCLFTAQWKWPPHAHAEGVDALVQSLAQFAREIDGGDVVRVQFDSHASRTANSSIGNTNGNVNASSSTNSGSLTPTHAKAAPEDERRPSSVSEQSNASGSSALEMLSHHNGPIQGVLFHDRVSEITTQRLRVFVEHVVERFVQLYRREIDSLQPASAAHQAALTSEETVQLIAPFASFDEVFENELVTTLYRGNA